MDGGGSWAIIQAMTLAKLYGDTRPGQQILNQFDLVTANSGGAIVLAGLMADFTPEQVIDLFNNPAKRGLIFVPNFLRLPGVEKYDAAAKLQGLRQVLGHAGGQSLSTFALKCKVLIPAFDYDRQRVQFFRTDPNSPAGSPDAPEPVLAEAVHATSNAPIKYFDAPAQFASRAFAGRRFWDGAMAGFNNPAMAGVTEALAYGTKPADLQLLTIGTASVFLPMPSPIPIPGSAGQNPLFVEIDESGLLHDLKEAAATILDDPPDQASYMAHLLISGAAGLSSDPKNPVTNGNVVRLNPLIQPWGPLTAPSAPALLRYAPAGSNVAANYSEDQQVFMALVNLEMDATSQDDVDLIRTLTNAWQADAAPNQPIRETGDMQVLIGHGTYSAAVARAKALGLA